jgi:tripartite-type tricarboxylate transporter receptor subunit TctC
MMKFRSGTRVTPVRHALASLVVLMVASLAAAVACAEDYPARAIKIVVPTGPSGSYDVVARILANHLSKRLGQGVAVENRTGAGTIVGTQSVISSPADGYTLLAGGLSNVVFNANLYKKPPYDPLTQLVPVAIVFKLAYMLVGSKDAPFLGVKDVIAAAQRKPNQLSLATAGVGTGQQLAGAAFMKYTGTKLLEVPYKGSSAVYPDLLAGRVDLFFDSATAALPYVQGGQVKGLAILASQRSKDAPDVPTMAEEGVQGLDIDSWIGLFAPAGTPTPVVVRLQKEIADAAPELQSQFAAVGGDAMWIEPSSLNSFVRTEYDKWAHIIKDSGIALD